MPQRPPRARPSPLQSVFHMLHRASQRADALFEKHIGSEPLTPRQFVVLQAVAESDGLSQTDIMSVTGIDRSSIADLVRRLVRLGYLQRRRTRRDSRVYAVRLTTAGHRFVTLGLLAVQATEESLLATLPAVERDGFLRHLAVLGMRPAVR
jgi:DNA-binding MarR family transcriptional regulator